jgi:two-component system sensor histidine kinase UhpB
MTGPIDEDFEIDDELGHRHVQVRVQALRTEDGSVAGTIGIQTDVTTLHRKEQQLIESNAKLSQMTMRLLNAQEEERRNIARDLHDQVGQILTALKLQLSSLARSERIERPTTAMAIPTELAEEALRATRDLSAALHPHLLDDLGLESALGWLADRYIRPSKIRVDLRCELHPTRASATIELVAFRVVQEALTNVVRHARASRVAVLLESIDEYLAIDVLDDGVGFNAGAGWFDLQRNSSLGMSSMHDRVTEVGGQMWVESTVGSGTRVHVQLPWTMKVAEKEHASTVSG